MLTDDTYLKVQCLWNITKPRLLHHTGISILQSILINLQIRKEKVKLSLFADDMILYIENSKDFTKSKMRSKKWISEVARYKIIIQKSVVFLCTNNELSEREIKKTIPFTIAWKWIKHLGINVTKEVKNPYSENPKTLMSETEDSTNKWEDILMYWRN